MGESSRILVTMPAELRDKVEEEAKRCRISMAAVIRIAVSERYG